MIWGQRIYCKVKIKVILQNSKSRMICCCFKKEKKKEGTEGYTPKWGFFVFFLFFIKFIGMTMVNMNIQIQVWVPMLQDLYIALSTLSFKC